MQTYHIDTDNWPRQDRRQDFFLAIGIFIFLLTSYLFSSLSLSFGKSPTIPIMIVAAPFLFFILRKRSIKSQKAKWKTFKLVLTEEGIQRYFKGKGEFIFFTEITKITYQKNRRNKIHRINIYTPELGFTLANINDIDHLFSQILEHIPKSVEVNQRRLWFDWENPIERGIAFILLVFGAIIYGQFLSQESNIAIYSILLILFGCWFLLKKPIAQDGGSTYKSDYRFFSITAILIGLALLGLDYMDDGPAIFGNSTCGWIGKYVQQTGCIKSLPFDGSISFLPDGTIAGQDFRSIQFRPLNGWVGFWIDYIPQNDYIHRFQTSENGKILVSYRSHYPEKATIWMWDIGSQELIQEAKIPAFISQSESDEMIISANGRFLAIPTPEGKEIWQINPWQKQLTLPEPGRVRFHPNEEMFVQVSEEQIYLKDIDDGETILSFEEPSSEQDILAALQFSPDGKTLVGADFVGNIYFWDGASGRLSQTMTLFDGRPAHFIKFSPDGRWLAIPYSEADENSWLGEFYYVSLIDLNDAENNQRIYLGNENKHRLDDLSFSFDSQKLAISNRDETMVFDIEKLNMDR